jgi:arsenite transporter
VAAGRPDRYIAGLIILAAAPCTAMVFVWSNLCDGEPHFTLSQVALDDTVMVFVFAPIVGLLLGLSSIVVPWETLVISVVMFIVIPVIIAQAWRRVLLRRGPAELQETLHRLQPVSLVALLAALVLLFGFQGEQILAQPLIISCWRCRSSSRSISTPASPISSTGSSASPTAWQHLRRSSALRTSSN